jgi:hypothetical protein
VSNVSVQIGAALGVAAMATVAASRTADLVARHQHLPQALTDGYRVAFLVGAGCTALSLLLASLLLDSGRPRASHLSAHEASAELVGEI